MIFLAFLEFLIYLFFIYGLFDLFYVLTALTFANSSRITNFCAAAFRGKDNAAGPWLSRLFARFASFDPFGAANAGLDSHPAAFYFDLEAAAQGKTALGAVFPFSDLLALP